MRKKVIIILAGAIKQDKSGQWYTPGFEDGDVFGVTGARPRIDAAGYLYQNDQNLFFIASGGQGQTKNAPDMAEVVKQEMMAIGIPEDKIILERNSGNTYEQLRELPGFIKEYNFSDATIISNQYHLPRLKAFIATPDLKELSHVKLAAAEDILLKYDGPIRGETIKKAYSSPAMKKRIKAEEQGIKDLRAGKYNFKQYNNL
jgi:phage pi2 protein 07